MAYRYLILVLALLVPARAALSADARLGSHCDLNFTFGMTDTKDFLDFDTSLRAALKANDAEAMALLVSFPFNLKHSADGDSIAINDATTLHARFHEIFSEDVRNVVLSQKPSDVWCMYSGANYSDGTAQITIDQVDVGELKEFRVTDITIMGVTPRTSATRSQVQFICHTSKHRILIDEAGDQKLRYRAWIKPHSLLDRPDMEIDTGVEDTEGSDVCAYSIWTFKKGNTQYQVSELGCSDGSEPKGSIGSVDISIGDKPVDTLWCFK